MLAMYFSVFTFSRLSYIILVIFVNNFDCQDNDLINFPLYRKYNAVFKVCQDRISVRSRLHCGLICSGDSNCVAFNYTDPTSTCTMCNGSNVVGLIFSGTGCAFWKTSAVEASWLKAGGSALQIKNITNGLNAGSVVNWRGVFLKFPGFIMNFNTSSEMALHFRTKSDPQLVLTYSKNSKFVAVEQVLWFKTFPFSPQREFNIQFLVLSDAFLIYIDGVYITNYTHRYPPATIKEISIIGDVKVIELSY